MKHLNLILKLSLHQVILQRKRSVKKKMNFLKSMKRRYENQLKRRQNNRPKRDSRIPDIEVDPLSSAIQSPSYGALALSIARHQVLLRDFALGEGQQAKSFSLDYAWL